jgi:sulfatase modifying factor 1
MFASNRIRGLANGIAIDVSGSRSPAHAEPFSLGRGPHMSRSSLKALSLWLAAVACLLSSPAGAEPIAYQMVTVGNPGNANDTTGYGTVAEAFQIMKFEFTNSQYAAFLNAIDPAGTNPDGVYNGNMGSNARGGITNTGTTNGSRYAVKSNMGDKPVNYVSWFDAARVSNWLHNGAQTYVSTDSSAIAPQNTGAYTVGTATSGDAVAVNSGALFYVPTENEWYKAAFYNPTLNGGSGGYRVYGNGFDDTPGIVSADNFGVGSAGGTGTARGAGFHGGLLPSAFSRQPHFA